MKKLSLALVALMVLSVLSFALAEAAFEASYNDGKVEYDYDVEDVRDVKLDGEYINSVYGSGKASYPEELTPGTHTITIGDTDYPFEVGGATPTDAPTQAPTDAPTQAPTEAPTQSPDQPTAAPTTAPTSKPTAKPTSDNGSSSSSSSSSNKSVPKTADSTIPTFVVVAMMVMAAAVLVLRRVVRDR